MRRMASERIMLMSTVLILGHWSFWISCGMVLVTTTCESQETRASDAKRLQGWGVTHGRVYAWCVKVWVQPQYFNRTEQSQTWKTEQIQPMSRLHLRFTLLGGACRPPQLLRFTVSRTCSFPQLLLPLGQSCSSFKIWWPHAYQCRFSPYDANKCWEKCGETGTPVHCCGAGVALLPNCGETWLLKAVLWLHEHPHSHTRHTQNRYKLILKDANNPSFQQLRKRKHVAQPTAEHFSGMETYYILKTLRPVTDDHSVKWAHGQIHREIRQC